MEKKSKTFEEAVQDNERLFGELTAEEQHIISCCTVLCPANGTSLRAMQRLLEVEWKDVEPLFESKWILRLFENINMPPCVAAAVKRVSPTLPIATVNRLLKRLATLTETTPFDDLLSLRPYFILGITLLRHVMENEDAYPEDEVDYYEYTTLVNHVASEEDLAWWATARENVESVTDRLMNKILYFVQLKLHIYSPHLGWLSLRTATTFNRVFFYPQALAELRLARHNALYWNDKHLLSETKMTYAEVYHNQGLTALVLKELKEVYDINKTEGCDTRNISVALSIAFECAVSGLRPSARKWLDEADRLVGQRQLPRHSRLHICRLLTEALLYSEHETEYALATIDEARSIAHEMYGETSSVLIDIYMTQSFVEDTAGHDVQSCRAYAQYVRMTEACFGPSAGGDISNLYCNEIGMYSKQGAADTAIQVCRELLAHPCEDIFPPCVRLYRYTTIAGVCTYLTDEGDFAREHIVKAIDVIEREIKPTVAYAESKLKETLVPEDEGEAFALINEELNIERLSDMLCHIAMCEGNTEEALSVCNKAISTLTSPVIRRNMNLTLGALNAKAGNTEAALDIWDKIIDEAPSYVHVIAQMASELNMLSEAKAYADIADASNAQGLLLRAKIYDSLGLRDRSDELFHQALNRSRTDMERIAIYRAIAFYRSSREAEQPLRRAIRLAEREDVDASDELRSHLYHDLAVALGEQGRLSEAQEAARKAVSLSPTECSDYFLEDIESYL